jgi:hypothetical protein
MTVMLSLILFSSIPMMHNWPVGIVSIDPSAVKTVELIFLDHYIW